MRKLKKKITQKIQKMKQILKWKLKNAQRNLKSRFYPQPVGKKEEDKFFAVQISQGHTPHIIFEMGDHTVLLDVNSKVLVHAWSESDFCFR